MFVCVQYLVEEKKKRKTKEEKGKKEVFLMVLQKNNFRRNTSGVFFHITQWWEISKCTNSYGYSDTLNSWNPILIFYDKNYSSDRRIFFFK